ncbi:hypothetical protein [Bradyrhizobium erythrophlei]|jgi:hypothetical protein|uniref:hypothetical protein n=1 Tax=Bradyrhizobium erythrophlei TaxID=1437360 RepID=UPI0009A6AFC4|nr:hypothetical protein [Bradyrhizobium erythrophlei]
MAAPAVSASVRNGAGKHYQLESFDAARRLTSPLFAVGGGAGECPAEGFAGGTRGKNCGNSTDIGGKTI